MEKEHELEEYLGSESGKQTKKAVVSRLTRKEEQEILEYLRKNKYVVSKRVLKSVKRRLDREITRQSLYALMRRYEVTVV